MTIASQCITTRYDCITLELQLKYNCSFDVVSKTKLFVTEGHYTFNGMNSPYYETKVITDLNDIGLPPTISKSSGLRRPQHHYAKPPPTPLPLGHGKSAVVAKRFNHGKSPSSP